MAIVHILMPMNAKTKNWLNAHVKKGIMPFGNGIVILESEIQYLHTVIDAMDLAGFKRGTKKDIGKRNSKIDYILNIMN